MQIVRIGSWIIEAIAVGLLGDLFEDVSVVFLRDLIPCALTLNNNIPVLDLDLDALGDLELFLRVAVVQLSALGPEFDVCWWWNAV
jgi:hypothetical protein